MRSVVMFVVAAILGAGAMLGQNELWFNDGTTEFTSRGATGTAAKTLMNRIPADQLCGAAVLVSIIMVLQDQNVNTPETVTIEVRRNNPAGPITGSPDMSPAGLIASIGPTSIPFPAPGAGTVSALVVTHTFPGSGLALPPVVTAVPAGDLYMGVAFSPAPGWTSDGISCHASGSAPLGSAGEQMNPTAVGYSGVAGAAGLGWDANTTAGTVTVPSANVSWSIRVRFADDVLQPFADNAAVFTGSPPSPVGGTGLNPNFGYAGIFPDLIRGDSFGFRCRATAAAGSISSLFLTPSSLLPAPLPAPPFGIIAIDPLATIPAPFTPLLSASTVAAPPSQPATTSEAVFGPFLPAPSLVGSGLVFHGQSLTFDALTGEIRISTTATLRL